MMNISIKFSSIEHIFSEEIIFLSIFFFNFLHYGFQGNQYKRHWDKNIWLMQDFSRNISIEVLSKYLQCSTVNAVFQFSPLKVSGKSKLP